MTHIQIRWLIRRDMDEVLAIEKQSDLEQWTEEDFLRFLRKRTVIGVVAETELNVFGFMIYELHKSMLKVLKLAVDPEYRRQGIGTQMVDRLKDKLSQQRRNEIEIDVNERNVSGQLFFAGCGFNCEEIDDDKYTFRYWVRNRVMAQQTTEPESAQ